MISRQSLQTQVCVLVAYAAVALAFAWPLPLHLGTHLTGVPGGDTGVYVWNQWVFQHEILERHRLPYHTNQIFALSGGADLSVHNYTTFQNILALPLIPVLGVVTTFNVIYLLMTVLTAFAAFLLARHVTGRLAESWLAGLLFAWSPLLVARGIGHFSLVAAAPLAVFLLLLLRTAERLRLRDACALGATVWWAASTDVYYAVYCLMIAAIFVTARVVTVSRASARARAVRWALDVLVLCAAGLVTALALGGGWVFTLAGRPVQISSLYTPVLALTILLLLRSAWHYRASLAATRWTDVWRLVRLASVTGLVATILLAPVLFFAARRFAQGSPSPRIFWRSSPPGVDILALVVPSPHHPLAPDAIAAWLTSLPNGFIENVASIPIVVLATLLVAWRTGWVASRWWMGLTVLFGLLALGPFVHVAGVNTYVPGPWALLRYVPIVGLTRTPARFSVILMLGLAVLFAAALCWLGRTYPHRRRLMLVAVGAILVFEMLPAPRPLYSAAVPPFYRHVADAPAGMNVLELPFGFRDGTFSVGNFTARSQFFQTFHGKPLIDGYVSRLPWRRLDEIRRDDTVLDALIVLSEGRPLAAERERRLLEEGPAFVDGSGVGYVVIDRARTPAPLADLAIRAFRLQLIEADGDLELYRPLKRGTPPDDPAAGGSDD